MSSAVICNTEEAKEFLLGCIWLETYPQTKFITKVFEYIMAVKACRIRTTKWLGGLTQNSKETTKNSEHKRHLVFKDKKLRAMQNLAETSQFPVHKNTTHLKERQY